MILKFYGLVESGDETRVNSDPDLLEGAVYIGGVDVVNEVEKAGFSRKVTAGILDERFDGDLSVITGWGYSEFTPMDSDTLSVGDHNLIKILIERYEGQEVTMFIADEPFNILE